jgi:high affinity Mn2+ porin
VLLANNAFLSFRSARARAGAFAGAFLAGLLSAPSAAQQAPATQQPTAADSAPVPERDWSLHGQLTWQLQGHGSFDSPYEGPNSFQNRKETRGSFTSTLFLGRRLWTGGEAYVNVELIAGQGLSRVLGLAAPPNGETYRVDSTHLKANLARFFLRQTFELGADGDAQDDEENQLPGHRAARRIVATAGKVSVTDVFDANSYARDPRTQFNNWSLWANAAWDYPADTRGYTWGVALELYRDAWAVRLGSFMEPKEANGLEFDHDVSRAHGDVFEVEHRHALSGKPGAVRVLAYWNHARMGVYREALDLAPGAPDITATRAPGRSKYGFGLNLEQEIGSGVGVFLRAGWNDGKTESWAFTEIERTLALGATVRGDPWKRPRDLFGVAVALNGINGDHRDYLSAGGLGVMLGDGSLHASTEEVLDAFYRASLASFAAVTFEVEHYRNPAFNRDRGPLTVFGLRLHADF